MRDYKVYVEDILNAVFKIEKYTRGMNFDDFSSNDLVQDAVIRNLEIIGEAAKKSELRKKYPAIEWKKVSGIRDILIHKYAEVNLHIIWDIVENKLSELKEKLVN